MTERQARLAPARMYLTPWGQLIEVGGCAHLEDDEGRITIQTEDGPLELVRAELRGARA